MDSLGLILIAVAVLAAAYLLVVIGLAAIRHAGRAGSYIKDTVTAPFDAHFNESDRDRRFRDLEREVLQALGMDETDDARVREDVVRAAKDAQYIAMLNKNLRTSVGNCLKTHWAVAEGLGASDMSEAARHPLSARLRQRVIDLSEVLCRRLERYPLLLDSPDLVRLQLGVQWIGPACATCPYFMTTVADAPKICPTASAMLRRPSSKSTSNGVIDGEVVEDCAGGSA